MIRMSADAKKGRKELIRYAEFCVEHRDFGQPPRSAGWQNYYRDTQKGLWATTEFRLALGLDWFSRVRLPKEDEGFDVESMEAYKSWDFKVRCSEFAKQLRSRARNIGLDVIVLTDDEVIGLKFEIEAIEDARGKAAAVQAQIDSLQSALHAAWAKVAQAGQKANDAIQALSVSET